MVEELLLDGLKKFTSKRLLPDELIADSVSPRRVSNTEAAESNRLWRELFAPVKYPELS